MKCRNCERDLISKVEHEFGTCNYCCGVDWNEVDEELAAENLQRSIQAEKLIAIRKAAQSETDHEKGVRLGWWNEEGESLLPDDDEDEENEDDE